MGLLRNRRAASPATSRLDEQHREVLLTATTIYRPPDARPPVRRTPPPALPSRAPLALPSSSHPSTPPVQAPPESPAETTAPIPVVSAAAPPPPATPAAAPRPDPPRRPSPSPRGEGFGEQRDRPSSDEQRPADWQIPVRRRAIGSGGRHAKPEPEPAVEPIQDGEAASLAAAFAADLASWDEENPQRRAAVLARYLPDTEVTHLWWDQTGRQRADLALPGRVHRLDDTHVVVDVRVRVTPFVRVSTIVRPLHPPPEHTPADGAVPAVAPSPEAPGWAPCDAEWTRLRIPISRNDAGGLVVTLDGAPARARGTG